jgi:hypothetical protein
MHSGALPWELWPCCRSQAGQQGNTAPKKRHNSMADVYAVVKRHMDAQGMSRAGKAA